MFEFHISEDHARRIHELAKEARQLQELFAGFNISAKYEIAKATGKGVERKRVIV
jgi:hypothetical protein